MTEESVKTEWLMNSQGSKMYPVSDAASTQRGKSNVNADLLELEAKISALDTKASELLSQIEIMEEKFMSMFNFKYPTSKTLSSVAEITFVNSDNATMNFYESSSSGPTNTVKFVTIEDTNYQYLHLVTLSGRIQYSFAPGENILPFTFRLKIPTLTGIASCTAGNMTYVTDSDNCRVTVTGEYIDVSVNIDASKSMSSWVNGYQNYTITALVPVYNSIRN